MEASELRIGNLVYDTDNVLCEVHSISKVSLKVLLPEVNDTYLGRIRTKLAEPIPLTEEWLERFGFEKNKEHGVYLLTLNTLNGFTTLEHDNEGSLWIDDAQVKCECVHQLQNIYFALTGEELTINEKV